MRRVRLSRESAVWAYVTVLAVGAGALVVAVDDREPLTRPHLPWWAIALGFAVAEACVVHVEFRRSAHSFSLADLPFVLGLVFASGTGFVVGAVLGSAAVYAARRLAPVKLAFNVAQLAVVCSVAVLIVHALGDPGQMVQPATWMALYVAALVTGALTILFIAGAMAIADGGVEAGTVRQMLRTDGVVTVTNASVAIAAAVLVSVDVRTLPVLLLPATTVFLVYRAYASERQRHEKLEFLYEANRTLARSPEVAEALEGLLEQSLAAFRSEIAEVLLFGADGTPLRTANAPGGVGVVMEPADRALAERLAEMAASGSVVEITQDTPDPVIRAHLRERGIRHAMFTLLAGEQRATGTILLANRVGLERGYSEADKRLLEALANNASVALQYDRLEQAVAKLRALQEQLHHQAYHDPLTDLPNRTLFLQRVSDELERDAGRVSLLFIDVDDFKLVNDSLGHQVGDRLLVSVARRLRHSVRPQDVVARLGGDEFAVMLPPGSDIADPARRVAARILQAFEPAVLAGGELLPVKLSVGIAESRAGDDADKLIREADVAMYQAKGHGKGRAELFDPAAADEVVRRHDLRAELARAIEQEQILVHYQPIVDLASGEVAAAEALVRWDHPTRGLVSPSEFVPLAEESGLIVPLGRLVLARAFHDARSWDGRRVHVNLSVAELEDPGLVPGILHMLDETRLPAERVVLEVTESQLMGDGAYSEGRFQALRDVGVLIALDDFGTGYSSLAYLHSLPLDVLKIAKPFVDGLLGTGREASFAAMIVDLARALELRVIAEGIESHEQASALRELGAEFGQGYLFARPAAADRAFVA